MENGKHLPQGPTRALKNATLHELVLATIQHFSEVTDAFSNAFHYAAREYGLQDKVHDALGCPVDRILSSFAASGYLRRENGRYGFTPEGKRYADSYLGTKFGRKIQPAIEPFVQIVRTRHRTYPQ